MAKRGQPKGSDGGSHRPFAALAGLKKELPKKPPPKGPLPKPARAHAAPPKTPAGAEPAAPSATASRPSSPLAGYGRDDRVAFTQAYAGVVPLGKGKARVRTKPAPSKPSDDAGARSRLDALVGGGVRFDVRREGERVQALRQGAHPSLLAALDEDARPERRLDLHGLTANEATRELTRFVREAHRRGVRTVLVVHGRGRGSAGVPVLPEAALECLTNGGAAPVVAALRTAPARLGGEGALLVRLSSR